MSPTRALIAAALSAVVIGVCVPAVPADASTRGRMVRAINYVRVWHHRHRLHASDRLARGAAAWARHLVRSNVIGHSGRAQGEIIEWHTGGAPGINRAIMAWWRSPSHHAVLMTRGFRRVGAGRAVGYMGGRRCTVWVVRFAR